MLATAQVGAPLTDNWNPDSNSVCASTVHAFSFYTILFGRNFWPSFSKGYTIWLSGMFRRRSGGTSSLWKRGLSWVEVCTVWSSRSCQSIALSFSTAPFLQYFFFFLSHLIFTSKSKTERGASSRPAEALLQRADLLPSLYLVGWICFTCI